MPYGRQSTHFTLARASNSQHDVSGDKLDPLHTLSERLYKKYLTGMSTGVSLHAEVLQLIAKDKLNEADILDYGATQGVARPRFALRPTLVVKVDQVAHDIQNLLIRLAEEVPARRSLSHYFFQLDPKGDLLPALRGVYTLAKLVGAWNILHQRFV